MNPKQIKEQEAEDAIQRHLEEVIGDEKFTNHGAVSGRMDFHLLIGVTGRKILEEGRA